eukprot:3468548-Rhodomonas_salina.3
MDHTFLVYFLDSDTPGPCESRVTPIVSLPSQLLSLSPSLSHCKPEAQATKCPSHIFQVLTASETLKKQSLSHQKTRTQTEAVERRLNVSSLAP